MTDERTMSPTTPSWVQAVPSIRAIDDSQAIPANPTRTLYAPTTPNPRNCAFQRIESEDQISRTGSQDAPDIRRARVFAADLENIHALRARDKIAKGQRAQKISDNGGDDQGQKHEEGRINLTRPTATNRSPKATDPK